jgi:hypothetical protein
MSVTDRDILREIFLKNNYFRADAPDAPPKPAQGAGPQRTTTAAQGSIRRLGAPPRAPAQAQGPAGRRYQAGHRGDAQGPLAPSAGSGRPRGRPPKPKDPLDAAVKQATAGMPKARWCRALPRRRLPRSRACKQRRLRPVKRGCGRPPKVRPAVPSETAGA